jgi:NADH dehydrogenase (ubiquinone) 1 alpha subcomplex subunit 10
MAGIVVRMAGRLNVNSPVLQKILLPSLQQACNISGKTMRSAQRPVKPAPYPYKEKNYSFVNALFDKTTKRFDDNSKVMEFTSSLT